MKKDWFFFERKEKEVVIVLYCILANIKYFLEEIDVSRNLFSLSYETQDF